MKTKLVDTLRILSLSIILSATIGYAIAAWVAPPQTPPGGSPPPPVNVGTATQQKDGNFFLGAGSTLGATLGEFGSLILTGKATSATTVTGDSGTTLTTKDYVDSLVGSGGGSGSNSPIESNIVNNVVYTNNLSSKILVVAYIEVSPGSTTIEGQIKKSGSSTWEVVASNSVNTTSLGQRLNIMFVVPSGAQYKVVAQGGTLHAQSWDMGAPANGGGGGVKGEKGEKGEKGDIGPQGPEGKASNHSGIITSYEAWGTSSQTNSSNEHSWYVTVFGGSNVSLGSNNAANRCALLATVNGTAVAMNANNNDAYAKVCFISFVVPPNGSFTVTSAPYAAGSGKFTVVESWLW